MIPGLSPYSPAEVGADEYAARSAAPPAPDIDVPAFEDVQASRGPMRVVVLCIVSMLVLCVAGFIATLP